MALVISVLNQKGGVGKTTLAVHIATALARRKRRVLLVDADPQASALDWAAAREGEPLFPVIGLPKASIHKELLGIADGFDTVLIDGPPRAYDVARSAIMASDVVLIPVQPSPYDVWAAQEIVTLLEEAAAFKPDLQTAFVINRKIVNTAIGRDVIQALSSYPYRVLKSAVSQRVAFAESAAQGKTVFETDADSLGSREMNALVTELMKVAA
jgi:chromosome partitioning protein